MHQQRSRKRAQQLKKMFKNRVFAF